MHQRLSNKTRPHFVRHVLLGALVGIGLPLSVLAAEIDGGPLLSRIQSAAHELNYSGTFTHQQGHNLVASQIVHQSTPEGGRERIEALDGPRQRETLRDGKQVYSLLPERELVLVEARETDHFPGMITGNPQALLQWYRVLSLSEPGRVAGRPCTHFMLEPRDALRWGYRICVDQATGLLLKVQTLDPNGSVIEQAAFSELDVGDDIDPAELESEHPWRDWHHIQGGRETKLADAGWMVSSPPGFWSVSQMQRKLKGSKSVHQIVLTDGLAAISVFVEPFDPKRGLSDSIVTYGATSIYRGRKGGHWVTVLGEVPPATVRAVAESISP